MYVRIVTQVKDPEGEVFKIPTPVESEIEKVREAKRERLRADAAERGETWDEDSDFTVTIPRVEATLPLMIRLLLKNIPAKTREEKGQDGVVRRLPAHDYRDHESVGYMYEIRRACVNPVKHDRGEWLDLTDDAYTWLKETVKEEGGYIFGAMASPLLDMLENTRGKLED